jgi:hypothetical protein
MLTDERDLLRIARIARHHFCNPPSGSSLNMCCVLSRSNGITFAPRAATLAWRDRGASIPVTKRITNVTPSVTTTVLTTNKSVRPNGLVPTFTVFTHGIYKYIERCDNGCALCFGYCGEHAGKLRSPCCRELSGNVSARITQRQFQNASIGHTARACHPATSLKLGHESTHGTLFKMQPCPKLLLRKRCITLELHQGMCFGHRYGLTTRRLVRTMKPKRTDKRDHLVLQATFRYVFAHISSMIQRIWFDDTTNVKPKRTIPRESHAESAWPFGKTVSAQDTRYIIVFACCDLFDAYVFDNHADCM